MIKLLDNSISLYIHIPFCESFCDYCDFFSEKIDSSFNIDLYLQALINDIKFQIEYFGIKEIPTAYIGGGTPSVLGEKIRFLFDELKKLPAFTPVEFTVEANPESLSKEFLQACVEGGINRLSLGIQTFHKPSRKSVNRKNLSQRRRGAGAQSKIIEGRGELEESLYLASSYFPDSLSIDLITGFPFQDEKVVINDIKSVLEFKPAHISLYSLTVEKRTPLYDKIKSKKIELPGSEESDEMWLAGREALLKAGFEHYEVSNFAKPGKRCLHNMCYWQMAGWMGAGPSASGTIVTINNEQGTINNEHFRTEGSAMSNEQSPPWFGAKRYTYINDVDRYIKDRESMDCEPRTMGSTVHHVNRRYIFSRIEYEDLDRFAFMKECLMMGFRCIDGPDPALFRKRFGCGIEECIPQTLKRWEGENKMLFLNIFLDEAFEEIENSPQINTDNF